MNKENLNSINTMENNKNTRTIPTFVLEEAWLYSYILVTSLSDIAIHIVVLLKNSKIHVKFMQTLIMLEK